MYIENIREEINKGVKIFFKICPRNEVLRYAALTKTVVQSFYRYRIFAGIEYLFTLHGINEKISRFKRTYYACLLHV